MIYLGPYNVQGVMIVLNPVFSSKNLLSFWAHVPDISYKRNVALTLVEGGLLVCLFVCLFWNSESPSSYREKQAPKSI